MGRTWDGRADAKACEEQVSGMGAAVVLGLLVSPIVVGPLVDVAATATVLRSVAPLVLIAAIPVTLIQWAVTRRLPGKVVLSLVGFLVAFAAAAAPMFGVSFEGAFAEVVALVRVAAAFALLGWVGLAAAAYRHASGVERAEAIEGAATTLMVWLRGLGDAQARRWVAWAATGGGWLLTVAAAAALALLAG